MLSTRNPLAYPAGAAPGFDQTHPAARNIIFSGVAGRRFRSIHKPAIASVSGTETYGIDGAIGPYNVYDSIGGWTLAGFSGAAPSGFTFAAIYRDVNFVNDAYLMCMGGAGFGGVLYMNFSAGGVLAFYSDSGSFHASGTAFPQGDVPVFVVFSGSGSTWNFVSTNLRTGQIFTPAVSPATSAMLANDGVARFGGANLRVAANMVSGTFLLPQQMCVWAKNPWSFWYPDVA